MSLFTGNVLLIDDDENVPIILRYHLERAGFTLLWARNPKEALTLIEQQPRLVAILLDIHIPRPEIGWALLDKLAQLKQSVLAETPLVVYSVEDDRFRAKLAGADAHVVKPLHLEEIIELIKKYAEQRSKAEHQ